MRAVRSTPTRRYPHPRGDRGSGEESLERSEGRHHLRLEKSTPWLASLEQPELAVKVGANGFTDSADPQAHAAQPIPRLGGRRRCGQVLDARYSLHRVSIKAEDALQPRARQAPTTWDCSAMRLRWHETCTTVATPARGQSHGRQRRHPRFACMVVGKTDQVNGIGGAAIRRGLAVRPARPGREISAKVDAASGIRQADFRSNLPARYRFRVKQESQPSRQDRRECHFGRKAAPLLCMESSGLTLHSCFSRKPATSRMGRRGQTPARLGQWVRRTKIHSERREGCPKADSPGRRVSADS